VVLVIITVLQAPQAQQTQAVAVVALEHKEIAQVLLAGLVLLSLDTQVLRLEQVVQ
jgi:hypothetical protein